MRLILLFSLALLAYSAPLDEYVMGDMIFVGDPNKVARNANMNARKWDKGMLINYSVIDSCFLLKLISLLGVIPYSFDASSGYTASEINIIVGSMRKIEAQTNNCLSFKERTTEANWVEFKNTNTGCNSYVGKVGTGAQRISLEKPGCVYQEVVIHELLHAAGYEHEQCRADRDQFIRVIYGNVQPGLEFAFDKISASVVNLFDIPYDYYSIMHYRNDAFSVNGRLTILALDPTVNLNLMGKRTDLSASDIKMIKLFYNCPL